MSEHPRLIEVRQHILKHNDSAARALREQFQQAGEHTSSAWFRARARARRPCWRKCSALSAAVTGSPRSSAIWQPTTTPAGWRAAAPVKQIITGTVCHLEADMVAAALVECQWENLDFLFIENVGNLVCPATFDLGENLRLVLFSVTEGEDKPLKYPTIFNTADVAVITKIDLAAAVEFDRSAAHQNIQSVRPGIPVWELSAKTGAGLDAWLGFLESRLSAARRERS